MIQHQSLERARAAPTPGAVLRAALAVALALAPLASCPGEAPRRPNLVVLVSDDQDYEHFGFMGHASARTPTLDALAEQGVLFTTGYVPVARCRPSLASLLSGRWPHQDGIFANEQAQQLDPRDALPRLLRDAGYATFLGGKFWEGDPAALGFEHGEDDPEFARAGQAELFRFVEEQARAERPFFVWWSPEIPHWPHDAPQRFVERIDEASIKIPPYYAGDPAAFRAEEHAFLAMGAWLDDCVRELRAELERAGVLDDTLFVFLIDNGSATGTISKGSAFEKGLRTPIVFSWPGALPAGKRSAALVSSLDVAPTLLDFAGVPAPPAWVGQSLRPLLEGRASAGRPVLFGAMYPRAAALDDPRPAANLLALCARTDTWKYVLYFRRLNERTDEMFRVKNVLAPSLAREPGDEDLYRIADDPYEQHDLAELPENAATLRDLREQVLAWWRDTGGGPLEPPRRPRSGR